MGGGLTFKNFDVKRNTALSKIYSSQMNKFENMFKTIVCELSKNGQHMDMENRRTYASHRANNLEYELKKMCFVATE